MGKNSGERKATQRAQADAYKEMTAAFKRAEEARNQYRAGSEERMKGVREIGDRALKRFQDYESGRDVGAIHPMLAKQMGDISSNYQALSRITSGMGNNALAQSDPRYMQKMQNVGLRDLAKAQGGMIASAAAQARDRDLGEYINAKGSLMGEERFGLGLYDTGLGQAGNVLGGAGQWRQGALGETQAQQATAGNVIGGITGVMGGLGAMGLKLSDERMKDGKKKSKYGLDEVTKINAITYNIGGRPEVGFSAQEVEKEMPELAGELGGGIKGVDYARMTAVHNQAISELKNELDAIKRRKGKSNA